MWAVNMDLHGLNPLWNASATLRCAHWIHWEAFHLHLRSCLLFFLGFLSSAQTSVCTGGQVGFSGVASHQPGAKSVVLLALGHLVSITLREVPAVWAKTKEQCAVCASWVLKPSQ